MASFGENLRREREMRGVTVEEISAATKISVRFLHALEEEEFSKLPGGVFNRSFIRAYARYLGLDEEPVIAEYQLVASPKEDVNLNRLTFSRAAPPRQSARASWLALAVAAALLGAGYVLFRYSRRAAEISGNVPNPAQALTIPSSSATQPTASPSPPPSQAPVSTAAGANSAPSAGSLSASEAVKSPNPPESSAGATPSAAPEGGLVLQVAATQRAWVAIDADGRTTLQRVMDPNEIQTLKAKESFDVTTGNAQGIILTLNGQTLKPLGRRGEVKSIHLTRDDLKNPIP